MQVFHCKFGRVPGKSVKNLHHCFAVPFSSSHCVFLCFFFLRVGVFASFSPCLTLRFSSIRLTRPCLPASRHTALSRSSTTSRRTPTRFLLLPTSQSLFVVSLPAPTDFQPSLEHTCTPLPFCCRSSRFKETGRSSASQTVKRDWCLRRLFRSHAPTVTVRQPPPSMHSRVRRLCSRPRRRTVPGAPVLLPR